MTDYTELVARLRYTPNWSKETYGSWKDCVSTYDRAPFEAADAIESLQKENGSMAQLLGMLDAAIAQQAQPEPLTDSYVQPVPDKCDRITWRNRYYHLPLEQAQPERAPLSLQEIADAWGLKPENIPASDIEAVREIEAAHGIKQGGQHD
jgi:hypothetical protein